MTLSAVLTPPPTPHLRQRNALGEAAVLAPDATARWPL